MSTFVYKGDLAACFFDTKIQIFSFCAYPLDKKENVIYFGL